jgi:DNA-binding Xre family transcriptional regulator
MRLHRDVSRADLAAATGIPEKTLQRLEAGEISNPGIRHVMAIAKALGCAPREIIEPAWRATERDAARATVAA